MIVTQGAEASPTTAADEFTYGGPSVSGVFPTAGPLQGGEAVTIAGSGFVSGSTVSFGGVASPAVTVNSDTLITAVAPAAAAGTVDILVTTPVATSTASAADQFTSEDAPTVSAVSPNGGPHAGGTVVTITGTGFVPGASVDFGSTAASSVTVISPTTISATSPGLYANAVVVSVTTPGGTSAPSVAGLFAYGAPSIQSVEPDAGDVAGGTFVAITGSGFAPGATVDFGANAASDVTVLSGNRLTAVAPPGTAGSTDVSVTTPAGTSAAGTTDLFAYGAPTLTGLTPSAGPSAGGTVTTIVGTGFVPDATVSFGADPATSVDVESGTKIVTITPPGSGTENAVVHTPAGDVGHQHQQCVLVRWRNRHLDHPRRRSGGRWHRRRHHRHRVHAGLDRVVRHHPRGVGHLRIGDLDLGHRTRPYPGHFGCHGDQRHRDPRPRPWPTSSPRRPGRHRNQSRRRTWIGRQHRDGHRQRLRP